MVDNDEKELFDVHKKLGELKIPATPYLYDIDAADPDRLAPGIRLCFLDIHIIDGVGVDNNSNFSAMNAFLSSLLSKNNGPYIAIAWTKDANVFEDFKKYLMNKERMGNCPMPIDVVCVDKNKTDEAICVIQDVLANNPDFQALVDWEDTVKQSAARTIDSLFSVSANANTSVNEILKGLGHSSIGHANFEGNVFMGVNESLIPILKDHQTHSVDASSIWNDLIRNPKDKLDLDTKHKIGPALNAHLLYEHRDVIPKNIPGAIVEIEYNNLREIFGELPETERAFLYNLICCRETEGQPNRTESKKFIKASLANESIKISWHLLELSPCCDYAQNKTPRSKYLIGVKIISSLETLNKCKKIGDSSHITPITALQGDDNLSRFIFCSNHVLTIAPEALNDFTCNYRMREQLFITLQNHYARHVTRPGLVAIL